MTAREGVVLGAALAQRPGKAGHAWAILQYALGLRALGIDVLVLDRLEAGMLDERDRAPAVAWTLEVLHALGLGGSYALLDGAGEPLAGPDRQTVRRRLEAARFLVNVMGYVDDPELLGSARRRVFLDVDPGFGQHWHAQGLADVLAGHDDFVTVGLNVGLPGCDVPDCGRPWIRIPPPVDLDAAPRGPGGPALRTVGSWRGPYAPIEADGRRLGLRVHGFRRYADLPRLIEAPCEAALEIDPDDGRDAELLRAGGWTLVDPAAAAGSLSAYHAFIGGALAELTIPKEIYVATRSGWIGDRTALALAAGRPALIEDTGIAAQLPVGEGLLTFTSPDTAAGAIAELASDPERHAAAARRIAERHLDARLVLGRLVEELGR